MALTCPTDFSGIDIGFTEFIECESLSINYDTLGNATLSFTVISANQAPEDVNRYNNLSFGGINFIGFVNSLEIKKLAGSIIYEHSYSISAIGCRP